MQTRQPGNATAVQTFSLAGKVSCEEIVLCLPADNINDNDWTWKELVHTNCIIRTLRDRVVFVHADLFESHEHNEM